MSIHLYSRIVVEFPGVERWRLLVIVSGMSAATLLTALSELFLIAVLFIFSPPVSGSVMFTWIKNFVKISTTAAKITHFVSWWI